MTVSRKTAQEVADVLVSHLGATTARHIIADLGNIPGDSSFRTTLILVRDKLSSDKYDELPDPMRILSDVPGAFLIMKVLRVKKFLNLLASDLGLLITDGVELNADSR